ncbi:MAG: outer membrane protein assembly factor BamE [Nevskiales bacterium]
MSYFRALTVLCFAAGLTVGLTACTVFRLPTLQGNVIEQKQVDQLEIGMTPDQVRFLLGSPLVQGSFDPNRWDYVYYYRSPRGEEARRNLNLYFENERLAHIVGQEAPGGTAAGSETPTTAPEDNAVDNAPLPDRDTGSASEEDDDSPISPP